MTTTRTAQLDSRQPRAHSGRSAEFVIVAGLLALGLLLRAWHIDHWMLDQDEFATFSEVKDISRGTGVAYNWVRSTSPLTHGLIGICLHLVDDMYVGLRLVPLVAGMTTLLLGWLLTRRLWGTRTALMTLALLALSPLPVYTSTLARYQSPVFLCGLVAALAMSRLVAGIQPRRSLLAAAAALGAGVGFHLSTITIVLPATVGLVTVAVLNRRHKTLLASIVATLLVFSFGYYLRRFELAHVLRNVLHGYRHYGIGYRPFHLLGAVFFQIGPAVALFAALGLVIGLRRRDPSVLVLSSFAVLPIVALSLAAAEFATGPRYLHAALPALFLLAAYAAGTVLEWLRGQGLIPASVIITLLLLPQTPTLVSNLALENSRYDLRPAAQLIDTLRRPNDLLLAESHALLDFYGQVESRELPRRKAELVPLIECGRRVLLVALYQRGRLVGSIDPELQPYIEQRLYLVQSYLRKRFDFYRFEVRLYCSQPAS